VYAAQLAGYGFEHVPDAFDGVPNFLDAVSDTARPELAVDGLGSRFEILATNIKKYAVGSPAQAAVQAAESLLTRVPGLADRVTAVRITLPSNAAHVVDDRAMPDVNVQYLVAGTLLDGRFTFAMAHDPERMTDSAVRTLRDATTLVPDDATAGTRSATVEVTLSDGSSVSEHVPFVRGTTQDPMTWTELTAKSTDLLEPVLGAARTRELIDRVTDLDSVQDIRSMAGLLHAG
jgi:2-methylcitrate dehydratase PrpD